MYPMIRKNSTEQHKTGIQTRVFFLTQNLLEQFEDANTNGTSTKDRQFNGVSSVVSTTGYIPTSK